MSCITKRSRNRVCAGSILMEFVIVLPIYILFFGMAFALGDIGLKAIGLASGDRLGAFAKGMEEMTMAKVQLMTRLFHMTPDQILSYNDDIRTDALSDQVMFSSALTYRRDGEFQGSWTWLASSSSCDAYALPPWTRGWLQYPNKVLVDKLGETEVVGSNDGTLGKLLISGRLGRANIYSRDVQGPSGDPGRVRLYNYYVLTRADGGRSGYRSWDAGNLAKSSFLPVTGAVWKQKVYDEQMVYETDFCDAAAALDTDGQTADANEPPATPSERSDYKRFYLFTQWSQ